MDNAGTASALLDRVCANLEADLARRRVLRLGETTADGSAIACASFKEQLRLLKDVASCRHGTWRRYLAARALAAPGSAEAQAQAACDAKQAMVESSARARLARQQQRRRDAAAAAVAVGPGGAAAQPPAWEERCAAGGDFVVLVHHSYARRLQVACGGAVRHEQGGGVGRGLTRERAGYLPVVGAASPAALSPVARMQVSAAFRCPNRATSLGAALAAIGAALGVATGGGDEQEQQQQQQLLRIDAWPAGIALGEAAAAALGAAPRLELTRSASKATTVLHLVQLSGGEGGEGGDPQQGGEGAEGEGGGSGTLFAWGLMSGAEALTLAAAFNHHAAREARVVAAHPTSGLDPAGAPPCAAPVSRAFFKMSQLVEQHLAAPGSFGDGWWREACARGGGGGGGGSGSGGGSSGLDLGAAPGGWTQALRGGCGVAGGASVQRCLGIDRGALASRVVALGGVTHARLDFTTAEGAAAIAAAAPFSAIVCDANIDTDEIVGVLSACLLAAARAAGHRCASALLCDPCAFVVTLKFGIRMVGAWEARLQRHLAAVVARLQPQLRELVGARPGEPDVEFVVVHLMANSPIERTILAKLCGGTAGATNPNPKLCGGTAGATGGATGGAQQEGEREEEEEEEEGGGDGGEQQGGRFAELSQYLADGLVTQEEFDEEVAKLGTGDGTAAPAEASQTDFLNAALLSAVKNTDFLNAAGAQGGGGGADECS